MTFLEWNNIIAEYFFNPDRAGKNVHLFISKQELISFGRKYAEDGESDDDIWIDFLTSLRINLAGCPKSDNIFEKAARAAERWRQGGYQRLDGKSQEFPPYISCLVFSVLPLLEIQGDYNTNNYYDRMEDFILQNKFYEFGSKPKKLQNLRNKLKIIDSLWEGLSHWANVRMNGGLGNFKAISFSNKGWKFVGKPLSQCILSPTSIRKLPEFFYRASLTPKSFYSDDFFKDLLVDKGMQWLGLRSDTIELIRKGNKDEIGKTVIEMVKTEFWQWIGEQHQITLKGEVERIIRTQTVVPLKLQFKHNHNGEILFSYRANYQSDPPRDLKLGNFEDIYQNEHWSKTLSLDFSDSRELTDYTNKWKAVSTFREMRLFINGRHFQLGSQFWIETVKLSRIDEMYLLCKNSIRDRVKNWCENGCLEFKDYSALINLPQGYSLFWFRRPNISHPDFEMLTIFSEKSIIIREGTGLKVGYNSFLDELLPEVELLNAEGDEYIFMEYQDGNEQILLDKHPDVGGVWCLPLDVRVGVPFSIKLEGEVIEGIQRNYEIVRPYIGDLRNDKVPKRNGFGVKVDDNVYFQGNLIQGIAEPTQLADRNPFTPSNKWSLTKRDSTPFQVSTLLSWLVAVGKSSVADFNHVFELIYHQSFPEKQTDLQHKRRSSLNLLDYLGYIDYDYLTGKILALPPKLITIPADKGRRALLIGCYTESLLRAISEYCDLNPQDIGLVITKQSGQNFELLLPARILFECNKISVLENLARTVSISFDEWYILKLKAMLPALLDYKEFLLNSCPSPSWDGVDIDQKIFALNSLTFQSATSFDRSFELVECRPRYVTEYGLWISGNYYNVEKNWGKYLFLHHHSEKLPTYDHQLVLAGTGKVFRNDTDLAIPAQLPLPKLYARIIMQLTGEAPEFKQLELTGKRMGYNIYRNIKGSFIENLFKFKLNIDIEIIHHPL